MALVPPCALCHIIFPNGPALHLDCSLLGKYGASETQTSCIISFSLGTTLMKQEPMYRWQYKIYPGADFNWDLIPPRQLRPRFVNPEANGCCIGWVGTLGTWLAHPDEDGSDSTIFEKHSQGTERNLTDRLGKPLLQMRIVRLRKIIYLNDTAVSDKSPELLVLFPSLCSTCVCWLISLLHFHPLQGHSTLLFSCSEPWVTSSGLLCSLDFGWIWPVASTTQGV